MPAPRATAGLHDVVFYVPTVAALLAGDSTHPTGGAETQVRLVARALSAQGVRTALVAFDHPGLPVMDGDVTVVARAPHAANPVVESMRIAAALRRVPSCVVVTRQAGAHTGLAALVTRACRRRFVYSAANVHDFDFGSYERHPLKRALFESGLHLAAEIVAQTDEQSALCLAKLGRGAPVIRSVAEPATPRTGRPEVFLWAGRVVGYKQPLAYVDLARALPEASFEMIAVPDSGRPADAELLTRLHRLARDVPNLLLLPPCSRTDLLARMERAVAVVSTSTTEGMPNIWLEGWSRGIPALTLAHDPDELVAGRGLGLSARGDPTAFVEAARTLWEGRHVADDLSAHCRAYVAAEHAPSSVATKWRAALGV